MTSKVKFTQFLWVRRGQPATEPVETGMCFVKLSACPSHHILFLPFMGCPHWAHVLNRNHASCIYETHKAQAWLRSGCLTRPCMGSSFSALVTLYFSLGFLLVFPCLSPTKQAYTIRSVHREARFQWRTGHNCPKHMNCPSASLALTGMFPQNTGPKCCHQRGCMKPS